MVEIFPSCKVPPFPPRIKKVVPNKPREAGFLFFCVRFPFSTSSGTAKPFRINSPPAPSYMRRSVFLTEPSVPILYYVVVSSSVPLDGFGPHRMRAFFVV